MLSLSKSHTGVSPVLLVIDFLATCKLYLYSESQFVGMVLLVCKATTTELQMNAYDVNK